MRPRTRPAATVASPPDPDAEDRSTLLSRGELQNKAIRGALWTLLHVVVALPLGFLVNIVVARTLGVVDYGRLAYLSTVMILVMTTIDLGIGTGVVQFGSKAHAAGRYDEVKRILRAAQGYKMIIGIPVVSAVVLLLVDVDPVLMVIALVFGVAMTASFGGAADSLTIENRTAQNAQAAMIVNVLTQVLVVVVAVTLSSADSVWAARLVGGGLGVLVYLAFVAPMYRRALLRPRLRRFPHGFWKFALPAGAAGMVEAFVSSRSEVVVLTWMSALEAAGVFALAFGLAMHLFAPAQSLLGPLVPAISGLREVDEAATERALVRTLRASSTATAALVAAATPAFALLVPVIYGEDYRQVPPVLVVLSIAGGLVVMAGPLRAFIMARLKGTWLLAINLVALVINVGLTVALVSPLGVWAAVVGNASAALVLFTLLLLLEARALRTGIWPLLAATVPFVVGAVVSVGTWWTIVGFAWHPVPSAVVAGIVGFGLFVGLLWLTRSGLTPQDVDAITRAVPARLHRVAGPVLTMLAAARDRGRDRAGENPSAEGESAAPACRCGSTWTYCRRAGR